MSENSAISWTHHTWSPWEGCTKVSPGCDHCYAERMNRWLKAGANWGPGAPRLEYSAAHWRKPLAWNAKAQAAGKRLRVFPSVCDPFDNEVSNTRRAEFIGLMHDTPWLDWLLLTKRIGNVATLMEECTEPGKAWALPPNAWIGATVVNQEEADRDIPKLLAVPARVRFLSIEPMLGPVNLQRWLWTCCGDMQPGNNHGLLGQEPERCCGRPDPSDALHWVICGGESGPHARDFDIGWARSIVAQCKAAGVAMHVKQMGDKPCWSDSCEFSEPPHWGRLDYGKGGKDIERWPEDLRIQEFPA